MNQPKVVTGADGTILVERFSPFRRAEHAVTMVLFVLLVATGLPQKLPGSASSFVADAFGGLDDLRAVHRLCGWLFTVQAVLHLGLLGWGLARRRMPMTLLPVPQDLDDLWQMMQYQAGRRATPPPMDRYDFRQKVEYLGMVVGGLIMIGTGLCLLFPVPAARLMGAQGLLAMSAAHSNEAVLAIQVLLVWHTYHTMLAPSVFPLDRSIFTGFVPLSEVREHRPLEYYRMFPDGELPLSLVVQFKPGYEEEDEEAA